MELPKINITLRAHRGQKGILNRSSRRKRGMVSNPLFKIPDFFCIFPINFLMANRADLFLYLPKGIFPFPSNLR